MENIENKRCCRNVRGLGREAGFTGKMFETKVTGDQFLSGGRAGVGCLLPRSFSSCNTTLAAILPSNHALRSLSLNAPLCPKTEHGCLQTHNLALNAEVDRRVSAPVGCPFCRARDRGLDRRGPGHATCLQSSVARGSWLRCLATHRVNCIFWRSCESTATVSKIRGFRFQATSK